MVESVEPLPEGPSDALPNRSARRLPRGRFWTAVAVGVVLAIAFLPLMEYFFEGSARTTWPAYAIVLPIAAIAAVLLGGALWARAAGAVVGGGLATVAVAAVGWFVLLSTLGGCGLMTEEVTWREPGLYALLDGGTLGSATWNKQWLPPQGALPFHTKVSGQPVPANLQSVTWDGPLGDTTGNPFAFTLARDGVVTANVADTADNATVVRDFLAFTAKVTTASTSQRIVWADEFQRTRTLQWTEYPTDSTEEADGVGVYQHSVHVPGPFRLEALANETEAVWQPEGATIAQGYAVGGGYSWLFGLAAWEVHLPDGSRGATLTVDSLDRVLFDARFKEGDGEDDVKARARKAMAEGGLPEPTFESFNQSGSIC